MKALIFVFPDDTAKKDLSAPTLIDRPLSPEEYPSRIIPIECTTDGETLVEQIGYLFEKILDEFLKIPKDKKFVIYVDANSEYQSNSEPAKP